VNRCQTRRTKGSPFPWWVKFPFWVPGNWRLEALDAYPPDLLFFIYRPVSSLTQARKNITAVFLPLIFALPPLVFVPVFGMSGHQNILVLFFFFSLTVPPLFPFFVCPQFSYLFPKFFLAFSGTHEPCFPTYGKTRAGLAQFFLFPNRLFFGRALWAFSSRGVFTGELPFWKKFPSCGGWGIVDFAFSL